MTELYVRAPMCWSVTFTLLFVVACADDPPSGLDRDAGLETLDAGSTQVDGGAPDHDGGVADEVAGLELFERLAGLWSGPATRTPLGNFIMMNVDFRAATDQFMFGRVDVDEENALRFGLSVETHGGRDVVTYRNGGYFLGMVRDDRTTLVEVDVAAEVFRFCHVTRGCDYIDAVYDFEGPDRLVFDVMVRGNPHVYWDARRVETRTLRNDFTGALTSQGTGDAPFPPMPDAVATVRWAQPLVAESPVWFVLSVEGCSIGGCVISRHVKTVAPVGATDAVIRLEQVHAGTYQMLAVIDRNANLDRIFAPDSGDGVSIPNASFTIDPLGSSPVTVPIVFDLP